jgi:hypothetical protein
MRQSRLGPCLQILIGAIVALGLVPFASAQLVDCSGMTPGAFTSINAALAASGNGAYIVVVSGTTCNEDVNIVGMVNVSLGTDWAQRAAIKGSITVNSSANIFLYGFDVTSPNVDGNHSYGLQVFSSSNVNINACTSTYNPGNGVQVEGGSSVTLGDWGNFSHNGDSGINVGGNSLLGMNAWGGEMDVMFNRNSGVYVDRSDFGTLGHTAINDNYATGAPQPNGFGIDFRGASKGFIFGLFGVAEISGNQGGGISVLENSEISIGGNQPWAAYPVLIATNSPVGISLGFASQLTVIGGTQINEHSSTGIDVFANSQANIYGDNLITHIGSSMDPGKAAVRVDGNSELYLRNGTIAQNSAPAIIAVVNSSVDAVGVSFNSNAGPNFVCDSSATIAGDMKPASLGSANSCKIVDSPGWNHRYSAPGSAPEWRGNKGMSDRFKAASSKIHHQ